jgi:short subunit dehydrogenase-like uncharacterized protein
MSWGIYGATGVTGRLIVAEAVARGHRPVLLGRSEVTLRPLAEEWGLEWRAFELVEQSAEVAMGNLDPTAMASEELTAALGGLAVVLNAATRALRLASPIWTCPTSSTRWRAPTTCMTALWPPT